MVEVFGSSSSREREFEDLVTKVFEEDDIELSFHEGTGAYEVPYYWSVFVERPVFFGLLKAPSTIAHIVPIFYRTGFHMGRDFQPFFDDWKDLNIHAFCSCCKDNLVRFGEEYEKRTEKEVSIHTHF
jgi:hypothetical protein